MLQEAIAAKQNDLLICIRRRNSKLRQLFQLTTRYGGNYAEQDEQLFLQANNIAEGRSFNATTLPPFILRSSSSANDPRLDKSRSKPFEDSHNAEYSRFNTLDGHKPVGNVGSQEALPERCGFSSGTGSDLRGRSREQSDAIDDSSKESQLKAKSKGVLDTPVPKHREPSLDLKIDAASTSQSEATLDAEGPNAELSKIITLPTDEPKIVPQATSQNFATGQIATPASTVHPPSSEVQEGRLHTAQQFEQGKQNAFEDASPTSEGLAVQPTTDDVGILSVDEPGQQLQSNYSQGRPHQGQDEALLNDGEAQEAASGRPPANSTLRAEMNNVRTENAFTGTPSTPNEQLRLEEAQALHSSHMALKKASDVENQGGSSQESMNAHGDEPFQSLDASMTSDPRVDDIAAPFSRTKPLSSEPSGKEIERDYSSEVPTPGLREHTFLGMSGSLTKDLTFSRRPPMRIDTAVPSTSDSVRLLPSRKTTTPSVVTPFTPADSVTNIKSGPPVSQVQPPPERMTTRVSSGALRHKSVSEILGETPRHATIHSDRMSTERAGSADEQALHTPKSATSMTSPDAAAFKQRLNRLDEKDRSKLSTVVFVRQPSSSGHRHGETANKHDGGMDEGSSEPKDYLLPLFAAQATAPSQAQQLHSLVSSAHKTLTTADHSNDFQEQQDCRILTRIYQLQNTGRWSLRQHERSVEPGRAKTHWDILLGQMRWMRTDFREERKWKLAAAKGLADDCAEWVASSTDERILLQVRVRPPSASVDPASLNMQTPELMPSREDDSSDVTDFESSDFEASKTTAPARIFSLPPDMFVFGLDKTPIADKILSELPLYQPSVKIQDAALNGASGALEDDWKTPAIPFSKFVEGKMMALEQGPARKRSRFDYSDEQEDSSAIRDAFSECSSHDLDDLRPEQDDVALFRHENKHIRDRIHAGHAFRPPSEYLMPSQSFFETRQSSQWTQMEDDELRRLVREYAYNWSLISSCLSMPSLFSSGAERRTPWECFERWVGLEGLPAEMSKTQYFKAYHARLQAAQRLHEAQQHALLQQHQGNNAAQVPIRRRSTLPFLVDRRKNNKHLHLVDAMRKLAKKRESAVHKQQHVANLAAMRKQNEATQPRNTMRTPQEFSRLKWEREQQQQEAARLYQQQIMQQRERAKNGQRPGQPPGAPNMMPRGPAFPLQVSGSSPHAASAMPSTTTQTAPMTQLRPLPAIPRIPNSVQGVNPVASGIPPTPAPPQTQSQQQRMPAPMVPENARIYQEALKLSNEQRVLATQTQHQHPQPNGQAGNSSSPSLGRANPNSQHNASLFAGIHGRSGSPSMNGGPPQNGSSTSPRIANPSQPQPLSNGTIPVINQIQNQVKARHPQASPEQINALTTNTLREYRTHALQNPNAATISYNAGINDLKGPSQSQQQLIMNGASGRSLMNSQEYAQMMRSQQSNQQSRSVSSGMHSTRTVSRSATPQTHPSHAPSQSPRPSTVQMAGAQ